MFQMKKNKQRFMTKYMGHRVKNYLEHFLISLMFQVFALLLMELPVELLVQLLKYKFLKRELL